MHSLGRAIIAGVGVLILGCACLAGCSATAGTASSHGLKTVVVELDWVPNPDHAGLYYAIEKGFFKREGLQVVLHVPSSVDDPAKLVALNKVDLAISYPVIMLSAQAQGLPIVAVDGIFPRTLEALIVSPKAGVTTIKGLSGHRIGYDDASDQTLLNACLKHGGLNPGNVSEVNVGFSIVPALLSGKVNAIIGGLQNVEAIQIGQEMKQHPVVFPLSTTCGIPNHNELILAANSQRLTSDPAYASLVRKFLKALNAGTVAAEANPQGSLAIMEHVSQYSKPFLKVSVPLTLHLLVPPSGERPGCLYTSQWQIYGTFMHSHGLITNNPVISQAMTDKYLPYAC